MINSVADELCVPSIDGPEIGLNNFPELGFIHADGPGSHAPVVEAIYTFGSTWLYDAETKTVEQLHQGLLVPGERLDDGLLRAGRQMRSVFKDVWVPELFGHEIPQRKSDG